jgi:hypothetical protein
MMKYIWKIACTGLLLGVLFSSCKDEEFNIGGYLVNPHSRVIMTDTATVRVSNMIAADSIVTSNKALGFSGIYTDSQIGTVEAQTFIEFSRPAEIESNRYASFDSIVLVLRPNGNYFGDTIKHPSFRISRLINKVEKRENGNLYSTSSVPSDYEHPLADTTLRIKVHKQESFEITLPRSFGEQLFQGILKNEDAYSTDQYLKTFPGLTISAGEESNCVHGLAITDTTCMIRIYYHVSTTHKEDKTMTFKANSANSFYRLTSDRAKLPWYHTKSDPISSQKTGNRGVVMSGIPLYARLEFPHLNEFLLTGQIVTIQKATLYIRPIYHSYDTVPLPPQLNIYSFDPTSNTPLSDAIRPSGNNANSASQTGNLPIDYQNIPWPHFPQYTFDVTDFISSQLGKVGYNKWALSLVVPTDSRETTLRRMVFGDQRYPYGKNDSQTMNNRIKLEITYVIYND